MENAPVPVPSVPSTNEKRPFQYQMVVLVLAVAAFLVSGKGWLMFVLGPLAVLNFIVVLIEWLVYRSKDQGGRLHRWAWPLLLSYQIAFFLGCFSAPFAGDTSDTTAFTFIPVSDMSGSVLYTFSYAVSAFALMVSLLLGIASFVFLFIKGGHIQAASAPSTAVPTSAVSASATVEAVAPAETTPNNDAGTTTPKAE